VKVVLDGRERFVREPVQRLFPVNAELIQRRTWHQIAGVAGFRPDVTIVDNRLPLRAASPAGFVLWHGFGWKGPNDEQELAWLHRSLARTWGSAKRPNPRLRWQAFGPWDAQHRAEVSRIHADNIRQLGAASHDDLREPLERSRLADAYPFDVVGRPTVLLAPTWHYSEVFAHWGTDRTLFGRFIDHVLGRGGNVIVRLHDSYRFDPRYVRQVRSLAEGRDRVHVKFKDESPDNYLDLQVSQVLVTNYSSIANLYYATGRPTLHIYPVRSADEEFLWRQHTVFGQRVRRVDSARFIWKLPPEDHGGLMARSFDELLGQVDRALEDPDCCRDAAKGFVDRHMLGADGRNCERIAQGLEELIEGTRAQR
jgi:CDP-glycerol glycerophosphotransferase (TagB/SpsB family)